MQQDVTITQLFNKNKKFLSFLLQYIKANVNGQQFLPSDFYFNFFILDTFGTQSSTLKKDIRFKTVDVTAAPTYFPP